MNTPAHLPFKDPSCTNSASIALAATVPTPSSSNPLACRHCSHCCCSVYPAPPAQCPLLLLIYLNSFKIVSMPALLLMPLLSNSSRFSTHQRSCEVCHLSSLCLSLPHLPCRPYPHPCLLLLSFKALQTLQNPSKVMRGLSSFRPLPFLAPPPCHPHLLLRLLLSFKPLQNPSRVMQGS